MSAVCSLPYQISYIWQVLVRENRLSIKLSYVDETVQNRPCCLVTNHRFFFIHTAHSHTFETALLRRRGHKLVFRRSCRQKAIDYKRGEKSTSNNTRKTRLKYKTSEHGAFFLKKKSQCLNVEMRVLCINFTYQYNNL